MRESGKFPHLCQEWEDSNFAEGYGVADFFKRGEFGDEAADFQE